MGSHGDAERTPDWMRGRLPHFRGGKWPPYVLALLTFAALTVLLLHGLWGRQRAAAAPPSGNWQAAWRGPTRMWWQVRCPCGSDDERHQAARFHVFHCHHDRRLLTMLLQAVECIRIVSTTSSMLCGAWAYVSACP